MKFKRAVGIT